MSYTINLVLFFVVVIGIFLVVRWVIKHPMNFGNLGRIGSALLLVAGTFIDQLNLLPWGKILSDAQAEMVGFALAVGMMMLHLFDMVKGQLLPPPEGK